MKRRLLNLLLSIVSLFISLEIAGYFSSYFLPDLYGPDDSAIEHSITAKTFQFLLQNNISFVTGWTHPQHLSYQVKNCVGIPETYSFDDQSVRIYPGYDAQKAQVLLIGDSYTAGGGVNDDETIAARIYQRSGIVTANLGVGGYGPVQALLRASSEIEHFPNARVVILGIMYENLDRMISYYRPAYAPGQVYAFSPYMKNGVLHTLDPHVFHSFDDYIAASKTAYLNDYWARPMHRFPYSLSLWRAINAPAFHDILRRQWDRRFHQDYRYAYTDQERGKDLFALLTIYAGWAHAHDLTPMVMFIPLSRNDVTSPDLWIERYANKLPSNLIVKNLDASAIDMARYSLIHNGACHPSPYAANEISRQYLALMRQHVTLLHDILYDSVYTAMEEPVVKGIE